MRVSFAVGLAVTAAAACGGCSSAKMPSFIPTFGKAKDKAADASTLTNAPPAPQLNSMANTPPSVTMPQSTTSWSNLPIYPGTSYPQTPYPATPVASAPTAAPQAAPYGQPAGGTSPYPATYGAMPAAGDAVAQASPYSSYPASAAQPYAAPQTSPYGQPPAATTAAPSYGQAAPAYAQQQPQAQPYGQPQTDPYAPHDPYASQPYNAANPQAGGASTYTR